MTKYFSHACALLIILSAVLLVSMRPVHAGAATCHSNTSGQPADCQAPQVTVVDPINAPPTAGDTVPLSLSKGVQLDHGMQSAFFDAYPNLCRFVDNNGSNDYFIPQATQSEFSSFLAYHPNDTALAVCSFAVPPATSPFVATANFTSASLELDSASGVILPLNVPITQITKIAVPTDQTLIGRAGSTIVTVTTVSAGGAPLEFFYTRQDCDIGASGKQCNTYSLKEVQTLKFKAIPSITPGIGTWSLSSTSSLWYLSTDNGVTWTPVPAPNSNYNPPALQSCTVGGVTYANGQTWTTPAVTTQTPTAAECPFGAGSRVDNMETDTVNICTNGTAVVQSVGAPFETGFTGACATGGGGVPSAIDVFYGSVAAIVGGRLYAWGNNGAGQLGFDSSGNPVTTPQQVGTNAGWTAVSFGGSGIISTSISSSPLGAACGINTGALYCWGSNSTGMLGLAGSGVYATPTQVGSATNWTDVSVGPYITCGIEGGKLYCWGIDVFEPWVSSPTLAQIGTDTTWTDVSVGNKVICGIAGGGNLYCWGNNEFGKLGVGDPNTSWANIYPTPTRVGNLSNWTSVNANGLNSVLGIAGGALYGWGHNILGVLGLGITNSEDTFSGAATYKVFDSPQQVGTSTGWTAVAQGVGMSLASFGINSGNLDFWGDEWVSGASGTGADGWIGDPTTWIGYIASPGYTNVVNPDPTQIYDWTGNADGDNGLAFYIPTQLATPGPWTTISTDGNTSCGIDNGKIYCWGRDQYGQLGNGQIVSAWYANPFTPQLVIFP
jgi:hypothetical protein